jgi:hypothetical protein
MKYLVINSSFNKSQLLTIYKRFGRVQNLTSFDNSSYILTFENEAQASTALLNTHGRLLSVAVSCDDQSQSSSSSSSGSSSVMDVQFATDISNVIFDEDESNLAELCLDLNQKMYKLDESLDTIENILAVEYRPSEAEESRAKMQARLKLQSQYEPPHMNQIEKYNQMTNDTQTRIANITNEVRILQLIAKDKAPLRHLRKYIDPQLPTHEQLGQEMDHQKQEIKRLQKVVQLWKQKCSEIDVQFGETKQQLMEIRIRYQTLKRMRRPKMRNSNRNKKNGSRNRNRRQKLEHSEINTNQNGNTSNDNHNSNGASYYSDTELDLDTSEFEATIEQLEMELEIANQKIKQFQSDLQQKQNNSNDNNNYSNNDLSEEMQIRVELLKDEVQEKSDNIRQFRLQIKQLEAQLMDKNEARSQIKIQNRTITNPQLLTNYDQN